MGYIRTYKTCFDCPQKKTFNSTMSWLPKGRNSYCHQNLVYPGYYTVLLFLTASDGHNID